MGNRQSRPTTEETVEIVRALGSTAEAMWAAAHLPAIDVMHARLLEALRRVKAFDRLRATVLAYATIDFDHLEECPAFLFDAPPNVCTCGLHEARKLAEECVDDWRVTTGEDTSPGEETCDG